MDTPAANPDAPPSPHLEEGVIVDLSPFADHLESGGDISHLLDTDRQQRIVDYVKSMVDMSYSKICNRYPHWTEADRAHDVYVPPDTTDFREKAVIADTRAVADTVLTYMISALSGRNPMFQLEGLNRKSRRASMILERVLHQHMRRTAGEARLAQLLLDSIKYGFAPTKVVWDSTSNQNSIVNFDPRRCFPDPRVHWGDWDNMQFIVFADFMSFNALRNSRLYPKLDLYPQIRKRLRPQSHGWQAHRWHREEGRGLSIDPSHQPSNEESSHSYFTLGDARVVDEVWVRLSGHEINIPQVDEIFLIVTILDEDTVIRLQINPYGRQFPVVIGGLYHDSHKTYGQSLYDLILPMHDIATYLLRSRIDNVSAALNNLIFADPTQVSIPDLVDRNPWGVVRTLPGGKPGDGIHIAQIPDVTAGHLQDINAMAEFKQRVSAASDAQQGMPTADSGRTATEIQRLTQLGSQRLGTLARVISAMTIRPMVRMMVSNIQDTLVDEGSIKVDAENMPGELSGLVEEGYLDYNVTKDLQGEIDYFVIDGTLPLEPTRSAETWMNMLQIMGNTGLSLEYNMGQVAEEAIRAMGVTDLDRFRISKQQLEQEGLSPSQEMQLYALQQGNTQVKSNSDIQTDVQKGNLVPLSSAKGSQNG